MPDTTSLRFVISVSLVATLGGFLFGFDSGVINGTVDGLQKAFNADSVGTGFNVASMLLGCAVGAFFAGWLADRFGRKRLLLASAVLFIVSAWGSGLAGTSLVFVIYRVIGGLAVGAASVMAPAYISEIAPARIRGRLTTVQQVAIITGLTAAFLSNYFVVQAAGNSTEDFWWGYAAWRWMFWMELFPAVLFFVTLLLIPESPRYLVAQGRRGRALLVLKKLNGSSAAEATVAEITESLARDHRPGLGDLFQTNSVRLRPIVWVGIGLAAFQQLVGINVVFYYGAVLWQAVGFTESDALLINIVSGSLSIGAVAVTLLLIDRVGRKPLLLVGSVGMALTLALVVVAFSSADLRDGQLVLSDRMGTLALVAANLYVVFFNFSWGPVMWVMLGEMFPNQLRGSGLAVSGLSQWLANFGITMSFPVMLVSVGLAAAYGFYAICALVSAVFVYLWVRETKGRTLESMTS